MSEVEEARIALAKSMSGDGADCPACGQFCFIYNRTITSTMAYGLLLLARRTAPGEWVKLDHFFRSCNSIVTVQGGDITKLKFWKFLEPKSGVRPDGSNRVGMWRVTDQGRDYVAGYTSAVKNVRVYNDRMVSLSAGSFSSVLDALGTRFSYADIMGRGIVSKSFVKTTFSVPSGEVFHSVPSASALTEARGVIASGKKTGVRCPVCEQNVRIYSYPMRDSQARVLIAAYKNSPGDWMHLPSVAARCGLSWGAKSSLLRHWGLVEQKPLVRDDLSPRSGIYRLSEAGRMFVEMDTDVPERVVMFNGKCLGLSGPEINISQALGKKFDYRELMAQEVSVG